MKIIQKVIFSKKKIKKNQNLKKKQNFQNFQKFLKFFEFWYISKTTPIYGKYIHYP